MSIANSVSESAMDNGVWIDKYKFDDAERRFHEHLVTPPKVSSSGESGSTSMLR